MHFVTLTKWKQAPTNEIVDQFTKTLEDLEKAQLSEAVAEAISRLPDKFKEVIVLRDINGLEYQEIAKVLRCPLGTVKSRVNRARLRLKELIEPRLEEYV